MMMTTIGGLHLEHHVRWTLDVNTGPPATWAELAQLANIVVGRRADRRDTAVDHGDRTKHTPMKITQLVSLVSN